jgi:hypothetical protein
VGTFFNILKKIMAQPLINGVAYTWSQVNINVLGRLVVGIVAIDYSDKQDMQDNYGQGNYVVSRGIGKIMCEASVTLEAAEVEALQLASPTGRIQDIPEFDVPISYIDNADVLATHTLKNVRFKENKRSAKSGDMTMEVELPLLVSHINWK